jgi:hypothetical protein
VAGIAAVVTVIDVPGATGTACGTKDIAGAGTVTSGAVMGTAGVAKTTGAMAAGISVKGGLSGTETEEVVTVTAVERIAPWLAMVWVGPKLGDAAVVTAQTTVSPLAAAIRACRVGPASSLPKATLRIVFLRTSFLARRMNLLTPFLIRTMSVVFRGGRGGGV